MYYILSHVSVAERGRVAAHSADERGLEAIFPAALSIDFANRYQLCYYSYV